MFAVGRLLVLMLGSIVIAPQALAKPGDPTEEADGREVVGGSSGDLCPERLLSLRTG